ncbi:MAG: pyroglutamyl-peptidase I [Erysipelotrichaceae bacterium]|nr:pyroglutamyl-peptidase I [Erysipelotrichaceae bacterium]
MKILLTAFEPFGGETINPAREAVEKVRDEISGAQIVKLIVPTVFGKSIDTVISAIESEKPDVVFCIGQAGGRKALTPEKVAINLNEASIPDNEGNQPHDEPICEEGPMAYFASLPVKKMVEAIREKGLPAAVSYSAGTFVCNHLMYGVLHYISSKYPNMKGGFMHVPYMHQQVEGKEGVFSLSLEEIVTGIEAAIEAIVRNIE